tara:strand:- start:1507 stop:1779 length:273 start_codon:yes stop_codon:yes gene_type:complete
LEEEKKEKEEISEFEEAIWSLVLSILLIVSIIQGLLHVTIIACFLMSFLKFNIWRSRWPEKNDRRALFYSIAYLLCGVTYLVMLLYYGVL